MDRGGKARLESCAWLATHISDNNSRLQHVRVSSFGDARDVSVIGIELPLVHSIFRGLDNAIKSLENYSANNF